MKKKMTTIIIGLILALSLAACSNNIDASSVYAFPEPPTEISVTYYSGGQVNTYSLEEFNPIMNWFYKLELVEMLEEPEIVEGSESFEIKVDGEAAFTYENRGNTAYLYVNGKMYEVSNLSNPPLEELENVDRAGESEETEKTYHDLSSDGSIDVMDNVKKGEIFMVSQAMGTNSTEISIKNESEAVVTVYLYNETDMNEPILQMDLESNETKTFSGLTSRFVYYVGILSDENMQLDITVTE